MVRSFLLVHLITSLFLATIFYIQLLIYISELKKELPSHKKYIKKAGKKQIFNIVNLALLSIPLVNFFIVRSFVENNKVSKSALALKGFLLKMEEEER